MRMKIGVHVLRGPTSGVPVVGGALSC